MNEIRNAQFSFLRANQQKIEGEVAMLEERLEVYHKRLHSMEGKMDGIFVLLNGDSVDPTSEGLRQITMKILEKCQAHQVEREKVNQQQEEKVKQKKLHWLDILKYVEKTFIYFVIGFIFFKFIVKG